MLTSTLIRELHIGSSPTIQITYQTIDRLLIGRTTTLRRVVCTGRYDISRRACGDEVDVIRTGLHEDVATRLNQRDRLTKRHRRTLSYTPAVCIVPAVVLLELKGDLITLCKGYTGQLIDTITGLFHIRIGPAIARTGNREYILLGRGRNNRLTGIGGRLTRRHHVELQIGRIEVEIVRTRRLDRHILAAATQRHLDLGVDGHITGRRNTIVLGVVPLLVSTDLEALTGRQRLTEQHMLAIARIGELHVRSIPTVQIAYQTVDRHVTGRTRRILRTGRHDISNTGCRIQVEVIRTGRHEDVATRLNQRDRLTKRHGRTLGYAPAHRIVPAVVLLELELTGSSKLHTGSNIEAILGLHHIRLTPLVARTGNRIDILCRLLGLGSHGRIISTGHNHKHHLRIGVEVNIIITGLGNNDIGTIIRRQRNSLTQHQRRISRQTEANSPIVVLGNLKLIVCSKAYALEDLITTIRVVRHIVVRSSNIPTVHRTYEVVGHRYTLNDLESARLGIEVHIVAALGKGHILTILLQRILLTDRYLNRLGLRRNTPVIGPLIVCADLELVACSSLKALQYILAGIRRSHKLRIGRTAPAVVRTAKTIDLIIGNDLLSLTGQRPRHRVVRSTREVHHNIERTLTNHRSRNILTIMNQRRQIGISRISQTEVITHLLAVRVTPSTIYTCLECTLGVIHSQALELPSKRLLVERKLNISRPITGRTIKCSTTNQTQLRNRAIVHRVITQIHIEDIGAIRELHVLCCSSRIEFPYAILQRTTDPYFSLRTRVYIEELRITVVNRHNTMVDTRIRVTGQTRRLLGRILPIQTIETTHHVEELRISGRVGRNVDLHRLRLQRLGIVIGRLGSKSRYDERDLMLRILGITSRQEKRIQCGIGRRIARTGHLLGYRHTRTIGEHDLDLVGHLLTGLEFSLAPRQERLCIHNLIAQHQTLGRNRLVDLNDGSHEVTPYVAGYRHRARLNALHTIVGDHIDIDIEILVAILVKTIEQSLTQGSLRKRVEGSLRRTQLHRLVVDSGIEVVGHRTCQVAGSLPSEGYRLIGSRFGHQDRCVLVHHRSHDILRDHIGLILLTGGEGHKSHHQGR